MKALPKIAAVLFAFTAGGLVSPPVASASAAPEGKPEGKLLLIGVSRGAAAGEVAASESEVERQLGDIGFRVRRPGAGAPSCLVADCLASYPTRTADEFVLTGSVIRTDKACTGTLFLSFAADQAPLSRPIDCHPNWSEVEVNQRISDVAGKLAEAGQERLRQLAQAARDEAEAAQHRFHWRWTWKRQLAVGALGIALAGTAAGLGALAGMNGRSVCGSCYPTLSYTYQGMPVTDPTKADQIHQSSLSVYDFKAPVIGLSVAAAVALAGFSVSLALP